VSSPGHVEEIVFDEGLSVTAKFERVAALLARSASEGTPDDAPEVVSRRVTEGVAAAVACLGEMSDGEVAEIVARHTSS
jgi:hypothetical protein